MRGLARNKTKLFYAQPVSRTEIVDEYGNVTGQGEIVYSAPVEIYMNIGYATGDSTVDQFGINSSGTRRLMTCDMDCPIAEDTILWIGIEPDEDGENGSVKHNFAVSGVPQRSLNQIVYTVMEVNVS